MLTQTHIGYFARIQSCKQGSFSNEYRIKLRTYKNGQLKEEYIAIDKYNFDLEKGLVKLVLAIKKGKHAHIVFNVAGCGGNGRLDIPIEDLIEESAPDED